MVSAKCWKYIHHEPHLKPEWLYFIHSHHHPLRKCDPYLLCGGFQLCQRCWHYCRPPCLRAGRGGALAHPLEVHIVDRRSSSLCRHHMVLQSPEWWRLGLQTADSVWDLIYRWDIWMALSAALGLTELAAGEAVPGCLDTEASQHWRSGSCPQIDGNSPVYYNWLFWLLISIRTSDLRLDPTTAVCLCVERVDSDFLKPRQSDNEADRRYWQQLLKSANQWGKVWEGTWWRMLVFLLVSTQLSTPRFPLSLTPTHSRMLISFVFCQLAWIVMFSTPA